MRDKRSVLVVVAVAASAVIAAAPQQPQLSQQVRSAYVSVDAPVIALTNARVIDGTGGPLREGQTIVIKDGSITAVGPAGTVATPEGARVIDLAGKTVLPGLVMVHEHLYYPVGPGVYGQLGESFTRLYLAGGVTTMRTGGNVNGFMDLNMKLAIERGQKPGPAIDATAPYLDSFVTWGSIVTTWMVARRIIENWLYWIVFDGAAVWLYYSQGLLALAALFIIYLGIVVRGYIVWRREQLVQRAGVAAPST